MAELCDHQVGIQRTPLARSDKGSGNSTVTRREEPFHMVKRHFFFVHEWQLVPSVIRANCPPLTIGTHPAFPSPRGTDPGITFGTLRGISIIDLNTLNDRNSVNSKSDDETVRQIPRFTSNALPAEIEPANALLAAAFVRHASRWRRWRRGRRRFATTGHSCFTSIEMSIEHLRMRALADSLGSIVNLPQPTRQPSLRSERQNRVAGKQRVPVDREILDRLRNKEKAELRLECTGHPVAASSKAGPGMVHFDGAMIRSSPKSGPWPHGETDVGIVRLSQSIQQLEEISIDVAKDTTLLGLALHRFNKTMAGTDQESPELRRIEEHDKGIDSLQRYAGRSSLIDVPFSVRLAVETKDPVVERLDRALGDLHHILRACSRGSEEPQQDDEQPDGRMRKLGDSMTEAHY
ncbi:MAG: hypothetical protein AAF604_15390 [Acidobacteriota bacterium]